MIVYHGGTAEVRKPDLEHTRDHTDFGRGFYVTEDKEMAFKWASRKTGTCFVNEYDLDLDGLGIVAFELSENWLDYVSANRQFGSDNNGYDDGDIDVIIGPTADDKLFSSLKMYWRKYWTKEQTMKCLNVAGFSDQIALKTTEALNAIEFKQSWRLTAEEKLKWNTIADEERNAALDRMENLLGISWAGSGLYAGSGGNKKLEGDRRFVYDEEEFEL